MPQIRPISDLRNNFTDISRIVHTEQEPVYLTKNGYGDMVVMSIEQYEILSNNKRIEAALLEADKQVLAGAPMRDFEEATVSLRQRLIEKANRSNA